MPILYVRNSEGDFIPIEAIKGASAYEQAKLGGYKGTEEQFIALLNGLTATEDADHYADLNNPHQTTAKQVGAIPEAYRYSSDLNTELTAGGSKMTISYYNSATKNSPYAEGLTDYAHGMVITNAHTNEYGVQLCMPSGSEVMFIRKLNKNGVEGANWLEIWTEAEVEGKIRAYAVDRNGDTMTGGLIIDKPSNWGQLVMQSPSGNYRSFETDDQRIRLDVRDVKDTRDRRYIDIFSNTADSRHSHALRFTQVKNGTTKTEYILHTANKPTGSYQGNSGTQTIEIGGIGNVLLITSSAHDMAFVTEQGAKILPNNSNYWNSIASTGVSFEKGVLNIGNSYSGLNVSGVTYNYQLL